MYPLLVEDYIRAPSALIICPGSVAERAQHTQGSFANLFAMCTIVLNTTSEHSQRRQFVRALLQKEGFVGKRGKHTQGSLAILAMYTLIFELYIGTIIISMICQGSAAERAQHTQGSFANLFAIYTLLFEYYIRAFVTSMICQGSVSERGLCRRKRALLQKEPTMYVYI